ncbi:MAG: GntR family transcriptional regulator [Blastococcus sp.]|nr:GntR family transcriptional regulator [Blastococcus sp.]
MKIRTGHYKPGEYLPPATEIQALWGVSRGTVGKATDRLKMLGMIESDPPKGLRVVGTAAQSDGVSESLTPPAARRARTPRPAPKPADRRAP